MNKLLQSAFTVKQGERFNPLDIFAMFNIGLFLYMCYFVYFDRFIRYRGDEFTEEFFAYAVVIISLIVFAWLKIRHIHVSGWLLVLTQMGIGAHFLGGLVHFGNERLYDLIILGVRYDKYVHFFNAIVATLYVRRIVHSVAPRNAWLWELETILIVLGLGAVVEIVEYMVMLSVQTNGVGSYDNNMQDMMANLTGTSCCILAVRLARRFKVMS